MAESGSIPRDPMDPETITGRVAVLEYAMRNIKEDRRGELERLELAARQCSHATLTMENVEKQTLALLAEVRQRETRQEQEFQRRIGTVEDQNKMGRHSIELQIDGLQKKLNDMALASAEQTGEQKFGRRLMDRFGSPIILTVLLGFMTLAWMQIRAQLSTVLQRVEDQAAR